MDKNERNAVKITVTYEDGSTVDLEKGVVFHFVERPEADEVDITADMVNMAGKDLYNIVAANIQLGIKLGMFNDTPEAG